MGTIYLNPSEPDLNKKTSLYFLNGFPPKPSKEFYFIEPAEEWRHPIPPVRGYGAAYLCRIFWNNHEKLERSYYLERIERTDLNWRFNKKETLWLLWTSFEYRDPHKRYEDMPQA